MHNLPGVGNTAAHGTAEPGPAGHVPSAAAGPERLRYLQEAGRLLWPSPAVFQVGRGGPARPGLAPVSEFLLLPQASQPRLLVPASRRAAAAAVRGYGEPGSRAAAAGARLLPLLLTAGLAPVAMRTRLRVSAPPGTATIESCLREAAGPGLSFSMHLGAPRANRKPVLQLLTSDGAIAGFAKIGINPLTSELVAAEHAALTQLSQSRLALLQLPAVVDLRRWAGLDVLVLSPLPVWHRRAALPPGRLGAAMAEVAAVGGLRYGPLAGSSYLRRLRGRLAATDTGPDRDALAAQLDQLVQRAGSTELGFGCWHGDWTPWNMASTSAGLLVWDWERFTGDVPAGFDALHCQLQAEVVAGRQDAPGAIEACARSVAGAPQLLTPFGAGPAAAQLTAVLYLADIAVRYLADHQEQAGQPLGAPGRWLIPAIGATMGRL